MKKIYVYDFDETIYDGDVTRDFYKYCLKRFPRVKKYVWRQIWALIKYIVCVYKWTAFKSEVLGYIKLIDNLDEVIKDFWKEHKHKIKEWYLKKDHSNDVIISASPYCLLEDICYNYLKVGKLIATDLDKKTGKIHGKNCYGRNKVERLNEEIKEYEMLEFYSDSLSDQPLADLAQKSYIVRGNEIIDWKTYKLPVSKKLMSLFLSRDFILFILIGIINTFNGVLLSMLFRSVISSSLGAFCLGYVTSTVIAYILNVFIIFKDKISIIKYFKFLISYIPNFVIQYIMVYVMCKVLNIKDFIAYLTAAAVAVPVTFLCLKLFAFKPKDTKGINPYSFREE